MRPSAEFVAANSVLIGIQAGTIVLPAAGIPAPLRRFAGRGWSILLPLSIVVVVAAIGLLPVAAQAIAWLSLITVPVLAAAALGWAMRGARPRQRCSPCRCSRWRGLPGRVRPARSPGWFYRRSAP